MRDVGCGTTGSLQLSPHLPANPVLRTYVAPHSVRSTPVKDRSHACPRAVRRQVTWLRLCRGMLGTAGVGAWQPLPHCGVISNQGAVADTKSQIANAMSFCYTSVSLQKFAHIRRSRRVPRPDRPYGAPCCGASRCWRPASIYTICPPGAVVRCIHSTVLESMRTSASRH